MIKKTCLIVGSLLCSLGLFAQSSSQSSSKSSSSSMSETVRKSKEQEAAMKQSQQVNPNEKPLAKAGASLPAFHLVTSDEISYFDSDIDKKKPFVLVIFNPDCGHCIDMGKAIKDSISKFKGSTIIFITALNQLGQLKSYVKATGLENMDNVKICADNSEVYKYLFEYNGMPQIMVYNKKRILQRTFYKYAAMDSIASYLKK